MRKLNDIIRKLDKFAPPDLAKFDYVGLLVGDLQQPIRKIGITLDCCTNAIEQAIKSGCDLLITHHGPTGIRYPLYGNRLKQFTLAECNNLSIYRAHLNLDFCEGGIIDTLCGLLKIPARKTHLMFEGNQIYGGVNLVENFPLTFVALKKRIKQLGITQIRIAGKQRQRFSRIAITSGQGFFGEFMDQLKPEVYIAGEFEQEATKYAEDLGIMLVELGHHVSEVRSLEQIAPKLAKLFEVETSLVEVKDTIKIINI